jgi:hypothetical protein
MLFVKAQSTEGHSFGICATDPARKTMPVKVELGKHSNRVTGGACVVLASVRKSGTGGHPNPNP